MTGGVISFMKRCMLPILAGGGYCGGNLMVRTILLENEREMSAEKLQRSSFRGEDLGGLIKF